MGNHLYNKIYCLLLNSLFATVFPLASLFYLNVCIILALRKMKNQETPGNVKVLNPSCLMPPESEHSRTHAPLISQKSADLCHQITQNRGCKQLRLLRSRSANLVLSENAFNITGYTLKYDKKDTTKLLRSKSFDEGSILPGSTDLRTNQIPDILVRKEKKYCHEKLRKEKNAYCRSCSTECCEQLTQQW